MSNDLLESIDDWGPEKVVCVSDRRTGMRGVLVIDNTARGMGKGGTRMSTTVTVREVSRLARTMTWKWAAVDLSFGGAKAAILGDPNASNKEAVLRAFARKLSNEVPSEYVFGLDMGLSENDAAIFLDELGSRAAAVGLPRELGGVPYDQLGVTGFGVAEAADSAAQLMGMTTAGSRVTIQGFGAVGAATAKRFGELGANVIAVSTSKGVLHAPGGLDVSSLLKLRSEFGDDCVNHYGIEPLKLGDELTIDTDLLVPAALQDVITADVARETKAKLVVEGANMPTTSEAKEILHARGITVVPDFIANAGGVIAAAFAMESRQSPFRADVSQIFSSVTEKLRTNTVAVLQKASDDGVQSHHAAMALAQSRVSAAMELRGMLPEK